MAFLWFINEGDPNHSLNWMILQAVEHPNLFPTGEGGAVKAQHTTRCPEEDAPLPKEMSIILWIRLKKENCCAT